MNPPEGKRTVTDWKTIVLIVEPGKLHSVQAYGVVRICCKCLLLLNFCYNYDISLSLLSPLSPLPFPLSPSPPFPLPLPFSHSLFLLQLLHLLQAMSGKCMYMYISQVD